ncbi:MAG TPA: hypothetical protein VFX02_02080 [Gammaproteobacteria bacterium]|nr:hypothetical protein [Gammaproteobacteria bacterium]
MLIMACMGMGKAWAAAGGPWSTGYEATVMFDDNIGRSQHAADIEHDYLFMGAADASYTWGYSELMALTVQGQVQDEEYFDFEGLSNTRFGLTTDFRFQTHIGFTAASYSFFLRVMDTDSETDIRDATTMELGFRVTKRITDIITGTLGLVGSESRAEGEVFDLENTRYFGNIDYRITNRWSAYLTYNFIDGDVFSTATPTLPILNWADAIEPDNAFGGAANNKFVYRLKAKTTIWRLGANYGIDSKNAVDLSMDTLRSNAAGPNEYDRLTIAATFLHRF